LEPGPVVLVTSAWKGNTNIMTMGWHMVLEFSPSLVACCISNANHSFEMIRRSHECVINVPTTDLVNEVIGIGNCSGAEVDKFKAFGLTPAPATNVSAPLIKEYYANFECRLANSSLVSKYDLFIWEVLKAHVASSPKYPETVHYRGQGVFMISGPSISLRKNAETVRKRTEDIALPAESFARVIAFAISQPDEMDVNEILFRPTRQVL
jgi:flavin reductase (DIM6/NTAB) family NADH-FMN oxidoreductase RutF